MVWPFSKKETKEEEVQVEQPNQATATPRRSSAPRTEQPLLLEETEPRFNNGPAKPRFPLKQAVDSIKPEEFSFQAFVKIPCFREALMTGISSLAVLGTIIFIAQKSPKKATNWAFGGFLLGSTVSWEQCRSKRRKEMEFAAKARETVANKERPMLKKPEDKISDDIAKSREEAKSWWKR